MRGGLRYAVLLALVWSLGLHWAVLQTVAWAGMLLSYSRDGGVASAVVRTFDGRHPCRLCLAVREGRRAEGEQDRSQAGAGFVHDLMTPGADHPSSLTPRPRSAAVPSPMQLHAARPERPPTPPPRA